MKHKVKPLIQTHSHTAFPQVDQCPWRKTNILTYLFLFYSLRKKLTIWQHPGTDGDCPLSESTSVYHRNLRSCSSKRMPQTGIFPQTAIVMDLRGNRANKKIQTKCFGVWKLHYSLQWQGTKSMAFCYWYCYIVIKNCRNSCFIKKNSRGKYFKQQL